MMERLLIAAILLIRYSMLFETSRRNIVPPIGNPFLDVLRDANNPPSYDHEL